jgi:hypothetical protein
LDIQRELPPPGSEIITREGRARVLSQSVLAQQLLVETEDHRRVLVQASDVLTVLTRGGKSPRRKAGPAQDPRSDAGTSGGDTQ